MNLERSTVLLTGKVDDKIVVLAKRFIGMGSRVILCGFGREKLEKIRRAIPELCTIDCDLSLESSRFSLFSRITKKFPAFNILVSNVETTDETLPYNGQDWDFHRRHLATNLEAPLHMCMMFLPYLLKQKEASIVNLVAAKTSANVESPTGCAAREGLKGFFRSLGQQLEEVHIHVVEVSIDETSNEIADTVISNLKRTHTCKVDATPS